MTEREAGEVLIDAYVAEFRARPRNVFAFKPGDLQAGVAILSLPAAQQAATLMASFAAAAGLARDYALQRAIGKLQAQLMRRGLPLGVAEIGELVDRLGDGDAVYRDSDKALVELLERWWGEHPRSPQLVVRLADAIVRLGEQSVQAVELATRLRALIGGRPELPIEPGDAWSKQALADITCMEAEVRAAWGDLLAHCQAVTGAAPTAKWRRAIPPLLEAIGAGAFRERAIAWFARVGKTVKEPADAPSGTPADARHRLAQEQRLAVLKGLVWCCANNADDDLIRSLADLAAVAYRGVPGTAARLVALGNACVAVLGTQSAGIAVAQLLRLKTRIKFRTAQKELDKALGEIAIRLGLSAEDLVEIAVPTYGLTQVGRRVEALGDHRAQITISDDLAVELCFVRPDGGSTRAAPAAVRASHAPALKELRAAARDLAAMLSAQRDRLDGLVLHRQSWPMRVWRERYLDHPVIGTLARRLVWRIRCDAVIVDAVWLGQGLVDVAGTALAVDEARAVVMPWHPVGCTEEQVAAWRRFFEQRRICQPFKQAHREVYEITADERHTAIYSNRFGGHILRQHPFHALCGSRGWRNTLRLMVDRDYPPASRPLPEWGLRAEFWIEEIGDEYGQDTNDTGTYHHVATDQVRFYPIDTESRRARGRGYEWRAVDGADEPLPVPLAEVPPLVFSEVMRDVDLFVAAASVGNDVSWQDGGGDGRRRHYWLLYALGELSPTARMRREWLRQALPGLGIAACCRLDDRFLIVTGTRATYKIHLGSGNVLLEPDDRLLRIPPGIVRDDVPEVFVPFAGDRRLEQILAQARLLAQDRRIRDAGLLAQIGQAGRPQPATPDDAGAQGIAPG